MASGGVILVPVDDFQRWDGEPYVPVVVGKCCVCGKDFADGYCLSESCVQAEPIEPPEFVFADGGVIVGVPYFTRDGEHPPTLIGTGWDRPAPVVQNDGTVYTYESVEELACVAAAHQIMKAGYDRRLDEMSGSHHYAAVAVKAVRSCFDQCGYSIVGGLGDDR